MEILSQLTKITTKPSRRIGRGIGSGNGGHTAGRGSKGDKARGKNKLTFDGSKIKKSWIKRLPFLRGKHRLNNQKSVINFNLAQLEKWFKANDTVDITILAKKAKLSLKDLKSDFKILAQGELTKSLSVKGIPASKEAKAKIIAAGGNID